MSLAEIKTIGILGAGQMGGGIAQVAAQAGFAVMLADASVELADKGKKKILAALTRQVEKGKMTAEARDEVALRITPIAGIGDFKDCDLVIEAATENVDLKLKLFKQCDEALRAGAWLASNTSSISVTKLAAGTFPPDPVIGMHFMNPPPL